MRSTLLGLTLLSACTTLGPTPLATGVSPRPMGRTSLTVGGAAVPGYFLSQTTTANGGASVMPSLSLELEPGADLPGVVVGARALSVNEDGQFEPIVGYRRELGPTRALALGGFLSGTHAAGAANGAGYDVTRVAGELAVEARLTPPGQRFGVHATSHATFSVSGVDGHYCVDANQLGVDCDDEASTSIDASATLISPALGLGLLGDFRPAGPHWLHRVRIGAELLAARVPRIVGGEVVGGRGEFSLGLSLAISAGAR